MGLLEERNEFERRQIRAALEEAHGNVTRAAKDLGVSRDWLKGRLAGAPLLDLAALAGKLRVKAGQTVGRPRSKRLPSERALRIAWAKHGTLDACAAALDVPRTTLWRALSAMRLGVGRGGGKMGVGE